MAVTGRRQWLDDANGQSAIVTGDRWLADSNNGQWPMEVDGGCDIIINFILVKSNNVFNCQVLHLNYYIIIMMVQNNHKIVPSLTTLLFGTYRLYTNQAKQLLVLCCLLFFLRSNAS